MITTGNPVNDQIINDFLEQYPVLMKIPGIRGHHTSFL